MHPSEADYFIAGDWGTSRLRLFLCHRQEHLERIDGPGVVAAGDDVAGALFDLIGPWTARHGSIPIILSGMVGSGLGWKEVPHQECPTGGKGLAHALHRFVEAGHEITIVPGLRCTNPLDAPDLMRGEETQIVGALSCDAPLAAGKHLVCLPGTHTKWGELNDGEISRFLTGVSGELFAALRRHSVLVEDREADEPAVYDAFRAGVERGRETPTVDLVHLLFEVRARAAVEKMSGPASVSFLSGLIVERDVAGALRVFKPAGGDGRAVVRIVGSPELTRLYTVALKAHGVRSQPIDGASAALRGLAFLHHHSRRRSGQ